MKRSVALFAGWFVMLAWSGCSSCQSGSQAPAPQANQPGVQTAGDAAVPPAKPGERKYPMVVLSTTMGDIKIELYDDKAPVTVNNFAKYVTSKFYDGTIFHRVIPDFMIQGGGMDKDMNEKKTNPAIVNEARNGLKNEVGTVAMARTGVPDSATAQFFINTKANDFLNHRDDTAPGFGYAVFGKVIEGMDVVRKIEKVATTNKGPHQNVPVEAVIITSATLVLNR